MDRDRDALLLSPQFCLFLIGLFSKKMKVGIGLFLLLFRQNFYTFPFFSAGDRPLMSMIKPLKMAHCKKYTKYKGAHNKVKSPDDAWSGQSASPGCFASTEIQAS